MVKIKKEITMSLDELIKWAKENNITSKTYKNNFGDIVSFDMFGDISVSGYFNIDSNIFVEIEEEITEDTILPEVVELFTNDDGIKWSENSINDLKDAYSKEFWLKDGNTMTLIWKDGKLV